MIKFKLGKETSIEFPQDWDEVTIAQGVALSNASYIKDDYKRVTHIMQALTGVHHNKWENIEWSNEVESILKQILEFSVTIPDVKVGDYVESFMYGDRVIQVPINPELKTLGQKICFETICFPVIQAKKTFTDVIDKTIAIYFMQELNNGVFDSDKIEHFAKEVSHKVNFIEGMKVASFFLKSLLKPLPKKGHYSEDM